MTRQTILGVLLLALGIIIIAVACGPVVMVLVRGNEHADVALPILLTGTGLAVFGAWLIPSSGVGKTALDVVVVVKDLPFIPTFGRREKSGEVDATKPGDMP